MPTISHSNLIACICEGSTEKTIIEILLEQKQLIFSEDKLLDGKIFVGSYRKASVFCDRYLTMDYGDTKISIILVQDQKQSYYIKSPYSNKIEETYLAITSPEIEMLMIHSIGLYSEYTKQKKKPSIFLAEKLKTKASIIKSKEYIRKFYKQHDLVNAIKEYKKKAKAKRGTYQLADFLK